MKRLLIILVLLSAFGCEESIDGPDISQAPDLLVVEGLLTTELKRHMVKLSRPFTRQNESPPPVTGATVVVFDSDSSIYILTEDPVGSGQYFTEPFRALFGKFYVLIVQHEGREYVAFDSPPGGELLDPLQLDEEIVNDRKVFSIPYLESGRNPNYISYDIDWSQTSFCEADQNCQGRLVNYDLKNIDVQEIYAPEKEVFQFPEGSTIIRRKHSLSESHVAYLRSLLSETEWRGGLFDIDRSDIPTNLSEGAIGFFGVSTVVSDTIIVNN